MNLSKLRMELQLLLPVLCRPCAL